MEGLFDQALLKVFKLFLNNPEQEYYLREVAKLTKVPPASVYRILKQLTEIKVIDLHQIKKFKLYALNGENTEFLAEIMQDRKSAVTEFVDLVKNFDGVEMIVLHGKEEKNRANILVIGTNTDSDTIKKNALYIGDKYKFNIILLTLTPDQYNQMSSMGLYPGKKRILFEIDE